MNLEISISCHEICKYIFVYYSLDLIPEFSDTDKTNPNCVVIGDAADNFSYRNLNDAFQILISLENPVLLSLGRG